MGGDLGQGTRLAAVACARICFEDEAGQSLRPGNARTWAPRGQTPVTRVSGNSGRLSVARVPCLKPDQPGRFSCRVRVRRRRKATGPSCPRPGYAALVTAAHRVPHRALNAPVVLVWDNLRTHRSQEDAAVHRGTPTGSPWSAAGSGPSSAGPASSTRSSARPALASNPRRPSQANRPWPFNLCKQQSA